MKKRLPIGYSTLENIVNENCVYVDKTRMVRDLVYNGSYYFLSRLRRFGKSLFIDTLKQAFLGNKQLFNGLYLENNWACNVKYPVIHISFAKNTAYESEINLLKMIDKALYEHAKLYEVELSDNDSYNLKFDSLIKQIALKVKQKVVILIDEYDKPILDVIEDIEKARINKEILKGLYSCIKDNDQYLKFVFLTGVTKFNKVSLFSGLNNLYDISLDCKYADICGYTQSELEISFASYLQNVDRSELKHWYNGYNFAGSEEQKVYNPFDVLLFINRNCKYYPYWFETATPTFLIKLLQEKKYYIPDLENIEIIQDMLGNFDIDSISLIVLLFQTGHLTIDKEVTYGAQSLYQLKFPNHEVKISLNTKIAEIGTTPEQTSKNIRDLYNALRKDNLDVLKQTIYSLFASIPHDWYRNNNINNYEGFYASIVYSYLAALGYDVIAEDTTNYGKIDLTVKFREKILIIEFKVVEYTDTTNALEQIKQKCYYEKYLALNQPIYLVGISFSKQNRNVVGFDWEKL